MRTAVALACGLLGFTLVAQVQATEELGDQLATEREEDLARILANLNEESDRLQGEITDLRLTMMALETSAEREEVAIDSLERRLDDLGILAGTLEAEGSGISVTIEDPAGSVGQEDLVDFVQELRDAGAEAIAVNDHRLIVSSAFVVRNDRVVLDGQPLDAPYRIVAVGGGETMAKALDIPGGAVATLEQKEATVDVETLAEVTVPARSQTTAFVFGEPQPAGSGK